MKTRLFTTILFFVTICIPAQTYKSILADNTAKWTIQVAPDWGRTQAWYSVGPANINNTQYTLVQSGDPYWLPLLRYPTFVMDYDSIWRNKVMEEGELAEERYLRESADNSKLYLYDTDTKTEYLIMDLNMAVGDTFYLPKSSMFYFEDDVNRDKKVVDSVYYSEGLKRVRLNALPRNGQPMSKLTFIEGIGPNLGVFYIYGGEPVNMDFFCLQCFQNKERFYGDAPCVYDYNPSVGFPNVNSKAEYKVVQTRSNFTIEFRTTESGVIYLYNAMGQCVRQNSFSGFDIINIDTSNLNKGVYVLLMTNTSSNMRLFTTKITLN